MNRTWYCRLVVLVCVVMPVGSVVSGVGRVAFAQTPAPARRPGEVASDPIHCWWKTDRTAIRVGERFSLVLTCGVIEAGSTTVVAATNQLEPGALSITPFEVVSGARRQDVVAAPWRYFQFEYSVRLLNDGFFGQDVNIPALTVTYNLQAPGGGTQGRDQSYILPALPMRVISLVPRGASDIRDASDQTFAIVESRRYWSSVSTIVAAICFAFAVVLGIAGIVRGASRLRGARTTTARPLSQRAMLGASLRALADVKDEARAGWTPELARRALAALRVTAAVAIRRPVGQAFVDDEVARREGQVEARSGWLRRRRAVVWSPTTADAMSTPPVGRRHASAAELESIGDALRALTVAGYSRDGTLDSSALDQAISNGMQIARRIRIRTFPPLLTVGPALRRAPSPRQASTGVPRSITEA